MAEEEWKPYSFTQSIEFQPWQWAKRWPFRLWIRPRFVTFTITFHAKHGANVSMHGVQVETRG